ncbi:hypothetical protein HX92_0361 [Mycobacterium tuberculosis]|uniref:Uncharacterized protein n=1 Tax=Mycobacterium tuberculosis (strain CDC 1551 / Oshkosh) TaxID=83331 RepID=Q8VJW8_MYCTO|nr:hypothetical protein MT1822 [Mycobacterium tuberculosis CDC1551]AHM07521.1 hypothetical protein BCGT_1601 [Mycobacterium tuberculosis variant bovis BCG str. ATCC 35743]AKO24807.1 hypothetical protein GS11_1881 [Mycobacterium tuberculosis variant bovis BCG]AOZ42960.1 hypothetical protein BTB1458_1959 [Mycobacterium tuberculosis]EQM16858.1 hypothetical protein GuangZ0019_3902 [Mycobacterium tuberculosis GuangZ0019]EQM17211.1 hypothetical protein FJ05194_3959 [Mycobacterium tuberculosis FJ0519
MLPHTTAKLALRRRMRKKLTPLPPSRRLGIDEAPAWRASLDRQMH